MSKKMLLLFIPVLGTLAFPSPGENTTRFEDQNLLQRADVGKFSHFNHPLIIDEQLGNYRILQNTMWAGRYRGEVKLCFYPPL